MKRINADKLKPGMVLGKTVVNRDGRRLLDAGIELTAKEIRILKMWGIPEIWLDQQSSESVQPVPEKKSGNEEKARQFLNSWFGKNDLNNPVIKTVYDICLERWLENKFDPAPVFKDEKKSPDADEEPVKSVKEIHHLLTDKLKLPALPTIFSEINAAIKNPNSSSKDIAAIVSKDPSLSATILKIVNSAYFGLPEKVESLQYASMVLGTSQVSSLALGITVINNFKGIKNRYANMESFWRHSVACAIAAKTLATQVQGVVSDRVFIGGMLHDIGWLVFLSACPDECNMVFNKSRRMGSNLYQVEKKYFGMTHADFGCLLAQKWNLSKTITAHIHHHHDRFLSPPSKEVAVVYLANWLVATIGIGFSGEKIMPKLSMRAWNVMELTESVLPPVVKQIDRQVEETIKFFYE